MDITNLYSQIKSLSQEINIDCLECSSNDTNLQNDFKRYNINLLKINKIKENIALIKSQILNIDENKIEIENSDYKLLKKLLEMELNLPELYNILSKVVSMNAKINSISNLKIIDGIEETIVCESVID